MDELGLKILESIMCGENTASKLRSKMQADLLRDIKKADRKRYNVGSALDRQIRKLKDDGLIVYEDKVWRLTRHGLKTLNGLETN